MAKEQSSSQKARGKKSKTPNTVAQELTIQNLQEIKTANKTEYGQPKKTREIYNAYVKNGKAFLSKLVAKRRADTHVPDDINTNGLEKAFDSDKPNKYSADVLELFLTHKCFNEGRGESTAEGIQGAWAAYWDNMAGDKYRGAYHIDETTGVVTGCPARSHTIKELVKAVRTRGKQKGAAATRHHAAAMKLEDLNTIIKWSECMAPHEHVLKLASSYSPDLEALMLKHSMMRAFLSSGFVLWTRNFELCALQRRDIVTNQLNQLGPDSVEPHLRLPFLRVHLENRKGWQNKQGWDGPLNSNVYHIYKQDVHALDMFMHIQQWITILEIRIGRPLEPDDYLFPFISSNSLINPKKEMTHEVLQSLLSLFATSAGITTYYTTHCLRRGGAQYRFMYAPIGQRWSLMRIRWWGGWAEGEEVDTLMRYLVDSLQSFETSHSDALYPGEVEKHKTFLAEGELHKPVTRAELRVDLQSAFVTTAKENQTFPAILPYSLLGFSPMAPNPIVPAPRQMMGPAGPQRDILAVGMPTAPHTAPVTVPAMPFQSLAHAQHVNSRGPREAQAVSVDVSRANAHCSPHREQPSQETHDSSAKASIVYIPNLARGFHSWREAVRQWEEGIPTQGILPLREWDRSLFTKCMREKTGAKRRIRQIIAYEYNRLERDDGLFNSIYGHERSITAVVQAIRKHPDNVGMFFFRRGKNGWS